MDASEPLLFAAACRTPVPPESIPACSAATGALRWHLRPPGGADILSASGPARKRGPFTRLARRFGMALLVMGLDQHIGTAQAWRDTFAEQLPRLAVRIWPD